MPQKPTSKIQSRLARENAELRARLAEAEETLRAIRSGEVDALVVPGEDSEQIFTLKGADRSYRVLIEDMNEGALTLTAEGVILYANRRFAEMLKTPLEEVIGSAIHTWIAPADHKILQALLRKGVDEKRREELVLTASDGTQVPVYLSLNRLLPTDEIPASFYLVATDLTEQKHNEAIAAAEKLAREFLAASNQSRLALLSVIEDQKQAEEALRRRLAELKVLYENSLALSGLLDTKAIGQSVLDLMAHKLAWHHATIRLYHPEDDTFELLAFSQPGIRDESERRVIEERFNALIVRPGQGLSGWVFQHGEAVRCGDVSKDDRYTETYPNMRSGLYVPLKVGEGVMGVISVESEKVDAFDEADETLLETLAAQAAIALENARLVQVLLHRVNELEVVNTVSVALRSAKTVDEMLPSLLDETLGLLKADVGAVWLYDAAEGSLKPVVARGWQSTLPHAQLRPGEGIIGHTFNLNDVYVTADYHADPHLYAKNKDHIPAGWSGVCLPLRTFDHTLGVFIISVPLPRQLTKGEINLLTTISEISSNAIRRAALHEQTENQVQRLAALREIDRAISSSFDLRVTLNIVLNNILTQLKVDAASVLLLNPHMQTLEYTAGRGFRTEALQHTHLRLGEGYAGRAALERKLIYIPDLRGRKTDLLRSPYFSAEGFVAYYGVPLIAKGQMKGVLEVFHRLPLASGPDWVGFLETLAGQVAIAIDNTQLFDYLQRSNADLVVAYDATIEGWSAALDLRDKETEGHSLRVTEMTMQLARSLGIGEAELVHIRHGALLHDIGKMGVPDGILLKPGKLTDEEWVLMRKHPQLAFNMLAPITYLKPALDIPYCHHEKWDGTGYPRGLKGKEIPLSARIFAVVDVYDALTSDRPYRKAWSKVKALEYIREQASKNFDPKAVESFLQVVNEST